MRVDEFSAAEAVHSLTAQYRKQKEEDSLASALFGGSDSVTISPEARERLAAASSGSGQEGGASKEETPKNGTQAAGPAASGGSGVGGQDINEQIEDLEKQMKKLQAQLLEIANNETLPAKEKDARIQGLQSQISQISAQIAELKNQQVKKA